MQTSAPGPAVRRVGVGDLTVRGRRGMKVSMTERSIGIAFTLVGAVLIGVTGYGLLQLFLWVLLVLYGRQ